VPDAPQKWEGERYYAVIVATSGRVSLRWSAPFAEGRDAKASAMRSLDTGEASLAFVVKAHADGRREPWGVYPPSANKIIRHYLDLLAALEQPR